MSRTRFQTDRVNGHRIAEPETLFPVGVAPGERKTPENPPAAVSAARPSSRTSTNRTPQATYTASGPGNVVTCLRKAATILWQRESDDELDGVIQRQRRKFSGDPIAALAEGQITADEARRRGVNVR